MFVVFIHGYMLLPLVGWISQKFYLVLLGKELVLTCFRCFIKKPFSLFSALGYICLQVMLVVILLKLPLRDPSQWQGTCVNSPKHWLGCMQKINYLFTLFYKSFIVLDDLRLVNCFEYLFQYICSHVNLLEWLNKFHVILLKVWKWKILLFFFFLYIYITYCIGLICTKTEKQKNNKPR